MEHKLACSAVSLTKVGETESPTTNCTVTFQLCQTQPRSYGPLLSIPAEQERGRKGPYERGCVRQRIELNLEGFVLLATVIANCQQASLSCGGQRMDTYDEAAWIEEWNGEGGRGNHKYKIMDRWFNSNKAQCLKYFATGRSYMWYSVSGHCKVVVLPKSRPLLEC